MRVFPQPLSANAALVILALIVTSSITSALAGGPLAVNSQQGTLRISGRVTEVNGTPVRDVTMTFTTVNQMGTIETTTKFTDATGNYDSGDLGCPNSAKVEPSKAGLVFTPQSKTFVPSPTLCIHQSSSDFRVLPLVVISQLYTGGGEAGATFRNDFVELFNRGGTNVDLTGWSVQFSSSIGTTWQVANLAGVTLLPGQHYLLQLASAGANGASLPTPDSVSDIAMNPAGGKVVLSFNSTPFSSACPGFPSAVVDTVGYGPTANCFEGQPASAPANTSADLRVGNGCTDTHNNSVDFATGTPNPRNRAAGATPCSDSVSFSGAPFSVSEGVDANGLGFEGTGFRTITVQRSSDVPSAASVDYGTSNGSAESRKDYTQTLGTLRFGPGETTKTFIVFITDDVFQESPETVNLLLSNPVGTALGPTATAVLTINSNDATTGVNPVKPASFNAQFFVRQNYLDFLNRDPDLAGINHWVGQTTACGNPNPRVCQINVSAAFFLSIEFQETGYLAYRMYKAAFGDSTSPGVPGTVPVIRVQEFLPDSQRIGQGVAVGIGNWQQQLEDNKNAYAAEFVVRQRFLTAFPLSLIPDQFVNQLNTNAGGALSPSERDSLRDALAAGTMTRAQVLRAVAEDQTLKAAELRRAFVLMQYFGYLRRNPDDAPDISFGGWKFWLDKLNEFNGNFVDAEMVRAFLDSIEYFERFGP
ncbi:MAG: lamin tail domain-containing protein [Pyrinomonadaceae bacterium]|nr:lamin tail domain-containing protein [Pyrinomonadaceae bacterium]